MPHGIPPEELAMFQRDAERDQREDNEVRQLRTLPLSTLVDLSKAVPGQSRRFVREILCRLAIEEKNLDKAEISSHAQDSMMVMKELHQALGEITANYYNSLDVATRLRFAVGGMNEKESRSFLNMILTLPEGDEDSEKEQAND